MRSRASSTSVSMSASERIRAAESPAAPAPITMTSGTPLIYGVQHGGGKEFTPGSGFNQTGADGDSHHACGFVHIQLFQDPAAVRVGRLVADPQTAGGFLRRVAVGN